MRPGFAASLVFSISVSAFGQITGITGNLDATMTPGQTQTFELDINVGSAGFSQELNFFINGSRGLKLGSPTVTSAGTKSVASVRVNAVSVSFNCTTENRDGIDFETCNGGVVALAANSKVHISQPVTVLDAASETERLIMQLRYIHQRGRPGRLSGIDDTGYDKVAGQQVGSLRSNFALIETRGNAATVRVMVYYRSNSDKTSTITGASATYNLVPNQMLMGPIANVLGGDRVSYGDLHNMTVEFQVVGGTGRVLPLITSVDNSTGDSIVRIP